MAEALPTMRLEISQALSEAISERLRTNPAERSWVARMRDGSGVFAMIVTAAWMLFTHCTVTAPKAELEQRKGEMELAAQREQLKRLEGTPFEVELGVTPAAIAGAMGSRPMIAASLTLKNTSGNPIRIDSTMFEVFHVASSDLPKKTFAINRPGEDGVLTWGEPVLQRPFSLRGDVTGGGATAVLQAGESSQTTELYGSTATLGDWIGVRVTITSGERKRIAFQMMQLGIDVKTKFEIGEQRFDPDLLPGATFHIPT